MDLHLLQKVASKIRCCMHIHGSSNVTEKMFHLKPNMAPLIIAETVKTQKLRSNRKIQTKAPNQGCLFSMANSNDCFLSHIKKTFHYFDKDFSFLILNFPPYYQKQKIQIQRIKTIYPLTKIESTKKKSK